MNRTHNNGQLRISDVGTKATLLGWVAKRRNLGSIVFIDLRDRYGITQITFDETHSDLVKDVRNEYVIEVEGTVSVKETANPKLETGEIEVLADAGGFQVRDLAGDQFAKIHQRYFILSS